VLKQREKQAQQWACERKVQVLSGQSVRGVNKMKAVPKWRKTMKAKTKTTRKKIKSAGPVEKWSKRQGAFADWATKKRGK
jgi:hypothetical protein